MAEVIELIAKYDIRVLFAIFEAGVMDSHGGNISNRSKKLYIHMDFACSAKTFALMPLCCMYYPLTSWFHHYLFLLFFFYKNYRLTQRSILFPFYFIKKSFWNDIKRICSPSSVSHRSRYEQKLSFYFILFHFNGIKNRAMFYGYETPTQLFHCQKQSGRMKEREGERRKRIRITENSWERNFFF